MSASTSSSSPTSPDVEEVFGGKKQGRPPGNAPHPVHKLFKYAKEENLSRCTLKGCSRPEILGDPHAHNRLKHLKSHHPSSYKAVLAEAENFRSCTKKPKLCTSTLNGVQMSKPALLMHCLRLVSEEGLSFKVLDYPALQDIIRPLINAMPSAERFTVSSKTIPEKIPEFAEMVRERIRAEVQGKMISLKVDGCTKKHRYFVGINVQFELDGESVVRTLAVEEMLQAATANNLRILLGIVLKNYRIEPRLQLVAFTVDSGANYVLAGKLLADLQIDEDEDEEAADADDSAGAGDRSEDEDGPEGGPEDGPKDGPEDDWLEANIELRHDDFCMQGVRCACHTLQLAVGDALKMEKALKQVFDEVRKLVKYLLRETNARKLRADKMILPVLDVVTRWGSGYDMLQSVARLRNYLSYSFEWPNRTDQIKFGLSEETWDRVDSILSDLKPVRLATKQLQREDITLGEFFAVWSGVVMALETRKDTSSLARSLLKTMAARAKAVPYKEKSKGNKQEPLFDYAGFSAAVFMDPRFMSLLTPDQVQEAKTYLLDLWDRMQLLQDPTSTPEPESEEDADSNEDAQVLSDEDEGASLFLGLLEKKNKERLVATGAMESAAGTRSRSKTSRRAALRVLLDEHDRATPPLSATANVFAYWKEKRFANPELYALAMVVLTIPASQVSVERLFSGLRFILRPQRFGLSSAHVDDVMFLNANKDVVQSVVQDLLRKAPSP